MTTDEIRKWLGRAFRADKKAQALNALVQQRRENATGLVRASEGNDKGKSDGAKNGTESAYIQLADIEAQLEECKKEADKAAAEIFDAIKGVHDDDLEAVLINRYLNYMTIEKTAEFMGYGVTSIKRKTNKAIQILVQNGLEWSSLDMVS